MNETVKSTITNQISVLDDELELVKSNIRNTQDHLNNLIGLRVRLQQEREALEAFLEEHYA